MKYERGARTNRVAGSERAACVGERGLVRRRGGGGEQSQNTTNTPSSPSFVDFSFCISFLVTCIPCH